MLFSQQHDLIKNDQGYYCNVCQQQWKGKPRKFCPGVRLVDKNHVLVYRNKPQDHLIRKNIKLLDLVCCYKQGKDYIYLYNPDGATEDYFEDLPEILDRWFNIDYQASIADCQYLYFKNIDGLKSLNLKPDDKTTPVACYWRFESKEFVYLYSPYDCIILDANLPTRFKTNIDLYGQFSNAIREEFLKCWNLATPNKSLAIGVVWRQKDSGFDWDYYYLKNECEIVDSSLPAVFETSNDLFHEYPEAIAENHLKVYNNLKNNLKLPDRSLSIGVVWLKEEFTFYFNKSDCEINDPTQ